MTEDRSLIYQQARQRVERDLRKVAETFGPLDREQLGDLMDGAQDAVMNWMPVEPKEHAVKAVPLPDSMFRTLDVSEEASFREWARANWKRGDHINPTWHPVVRDECMRIATEGIMVEALKPEHRPRLGVEVERPGVQATYDLGVLWYARRKTGKVHKTFMDSPGFITGCGLTLSREGTMVRPQAGDAPAIADRCARCFA